MALIDRRRWPFPEDKEEQKRALKKLIDISRYLPDGEFVGTLIRIKANGGKAYYIVSEWEPLVLRWIPFGEVRVDEMVSKAITPAFVKQIREHEELLRNI